MITQDSVLVQLIRLIDRIPTPTEKLAECLILL
jgi:hypothetical protein